MSDAKETAVPHREVGWNLLIPGVWTDAGSHPREHRLVTKHIRCDEAALRPRTLAQLPRRRRGDDAIRAAYGPNYDRLREIKRRYDPDNVFHLNPNITP